MKWRLVAFGVLGAVASFSMAESLGLGAVRVMIADGRYADALAALDEDSRSGAGGPESIFLRGVALVGAQRHGEAETVFRHLIAEYPDRPEAYNNLAVLQAEAGRYDEAVETLKGALRTSEAHRTAWENLTTVYGKLASDAYSKALNLGSPVPRDSVRLVLLEDLAMPGAVAMPEPEAVVAEARPEPPMPVAAPPPVPPEPVAGAEETVVEPIAPAEPVAGRPAPAEPLGEAEAGDEVTGEAATGEPAGEDEVAEPAEVAAEHESSAAELVTFVESWAAAWSAQDADGYLSYYADDFVAADGSSRADWADLRRSRLAAPEYIVVSVAVLDFELTGDTASVSFNQSYESNTFSDVVTKRLELERRDGSWQITKEIVTP